MEGTRGEGGTIPRLGKGGVAALLIKCRGASKVAQTGRFVQIPRRSVGKLKEPPRPHLSKDAFGDIQAFILDLVS